MHMDWVVSFYHNIHVLFRFQENITAGDVGDYCIPVSSKANLPSMILYSIIGVAMTLFLL